MDEEGKLIHKSAIKESVSSPFDELFHKTSDRDEIKPLSSLIHEGDVPQNLEDIIQRGLIYCKEHNIHPRDTRLPYYFAGIADMLSFNQIHTDYDEMSRVVCLVETFVNSGMKLHEIHVHGYIYDGAYYETLLTVSLRHGWIRIAEALLTSPNICLSVNDCYELEELFIRADNMKRLADLAFRRRPLPTEGEFSSSPDTPRKRPRYDALSSSADESMNTE